MTIAKIQQEGPTDGFMRGFGPDTERTAPFLAGAPLASSSCTYGTSPASSAATASPPQTYANNTRVNTRTGLVPLNGFRPPSRRPHA